MIKSTIKPCSQLSISGVRFAAAVITNDRCSGGTSVEMRLPLFYPSTMTLRGLTVLEHHGCHVRASGRMRHSMHSKAFIGVGLGFGVDVLTHSTATLQEWHWCWWVWFAKMGGSPPDTLGLTCGATWGWQQRNSGRSWEANLHAGNGVLGTLSLPKLIFLVSEPAQRYHSISPRHNSV